MSPAENDNSPYAVFPLDRSPGYIIHRLDTQLAAGLQRAFQARGHAITTEQWGVLSRLWEREGIHQSELAARTGKDRHNIARIVKLLERNGFIHRRPDPGDKRRQLVFLTPEGRRMEDELPAIVSDYLKTCLRGLTRRELDQMRRIHLRILSNLNGDPAA